MAEHALLSSGASAWRSLACAKSELRLDLALAGGQSFRWRETAEGHWTGVMGGRVWTLTQTDDTLWYHVYKSSAGQGEVRDGERERKRRAGASLQVENKLGKEEEEPVAVTPVQDTEEEKEMMEEEEEEMLRDYFQLKVKLGHLYKEWGAADPHFQSIADIFTGVRMLRQDPTECLFSFICTSNNHISRIHGMVERLCRALGAPLCRLEETSYHDFPSLAALAGDGVEARLRDLGFGYRARFLQRSAAQILEAHGPRWLEGLRGVPYLVARDALRTLPGVGTKVADCVCLMSLDKAEAVPVDTHVWQIAKRDYSYAPGSRQKSITDKLHRDLGDFFRHLWGPHAGALLRRPQEVPEAERNVAPEAAEERGRRGGGSGERERRRREKTEPRGTRKTRSGKRRRPPRRRERCEVNELLASGLASDFNTTL